MHTLPSHPCFCHSGTPYENNRRLIRRVIDDRFVPVQVQLLEQGKINLATEVQRALREPIVDAVCVRMERRMLPVRSLSARANAELSRMLGRLFPARRSSFLASLKRLLPFVRFRCSRERDGICNCMERCSSLYSPHNFRMH